MSLEIHMDRVNLKPLPWGTNTILKLVFKDGDKTQCLTINRDHFMFRVNGDGQSEGYIGWYDDSRVHLPKEVCDPDRLEDVLESLMLGEGGSTGKLWLDVQNRPTASILIGKVTRPSPPSNKRKYNVKNAGEAKITYVFLEVNAQTMKETGECNLCVGVMDSQNGGDALSRRISTAGGQKNCFEAGVAISIPGIKGAMFHPVKSTKQIVVGGHTRFDDGSEFFNYWKDTNLTYSSCKQLVKGQNVSIVMNENTASALQATSDEVEMHPKEVQLSIKRQVQARIQAMNKCKAGKARVMAPAIVSHRKLKQKSDFQPRDPELEILRQGPACNAFATVLSLAVLCQCIKSISESVGDFVRGMLAIVLFSNLKWRVEEPVPVDKAHVSYKQFSTFDLDQASLDVRNIGRYIKLFSTNGELLEYYYQALLNKVFEGEVPSGINTVNFTAFSNPKIRAKGGHTFLPDDLRKKYLLITDGAGHYEEVLRIAMYLRKSNRMVDQSMPKLDAYFDPLEQTLLRGYDGMKVPERLFTAMTLVAKFLNDRIGTAHGSTNNALLHHLGKEAVRGYNQLHCHGGALLHVLTTIQAAALEELNKKREGTTPAYTVSVSLETYGGKSRGEQSIMKLDEVDSGSREGMVSGVVDRICPKQCSAASIVANFSTFCAQELAIRSPSENNMYWGVGATYWGFHLETDRPLYAALNWTDMDNYVKIGGSNWTTTTDDVMTAEDDDADDDIGEGEYDDFDDEGANEIPADMPTIARQFEFPLKGRLEYRTEDSDGGEWNTDPYPTMGGLLPVNLQPVTMKKLSSGRSTATCSCSLEKLQHYSVLGRNAMGECNRSDKSRITGIAAACFKEFSIGTCIFGKAVSREYRYDHHREKLNNAYLWLKRNCAELRSQGNAARLELGFKSTNFDDHNKSLREAVDTHLSMMRSCLHFYDIVEPLATCMEFFGLGLRQRSDFAVSKCNQDAARHEALEEMFTCINEEVGWWRRWYSGRRVFAAPAIICKKIGLLAGRPILAVLPQQLNMELLKKVPSFSALSTAFLDKAQLLYSPAVTIERSSSLPFESIPVPTGKVCKTCGWVYDGSETFFRHPCKEKLITEETAVSVISDKFKQLVDGWYTQLTAHQKLVVDVAEDGVTNIFLTGYAGCGKTRALHCTIAKLRVKYGTDRVSAVCYTKAAANAVRGDSIHSFLNLTHEDDMDKITEISLCKKLRADEKKLAVVKRINTLVIDEISMLHGRTLQAMHLAFGILRQRVGEPFGGIQIILCGDILQIPPLDTNGNSNSNECPDYFFRAPIWTNRERPFHNMYLKYIHRQTSNHELLNRIRIGCPTDEDIEYLNANCGNQASREVIEFVIDIMKKLNDDENKSKPKRHCSKVNIHWLAGRGGYYEDGNLDEYRTEHLTSSALQSELNERPFANNCSHGKSILELFEKHFVVGLENAEGVAIGDTLQQYLGSADQGGLRVTTHRSEGKDEYFKYCTPKKGPCLNAAVAMIEKNQSIEYDYIMKQTPFRFHDARERAKELIMYIGQVVILKSNQIDRLAANNSTGVITGFKMMDNEPSVIDEVYVQLLGSDNTINQPIVTVKRDWKLTSKRKIDNTYLLVIRNQFPLMPARWSTGYSLQGMTLKDLILIFNNTRNTRNKFGLFYVLISRMNDITKFCTVRKIVKEDIRVNKHAEWFDRYHASMPDVDKEGNPIMHVVDYDNFFVQKHFVLCNTSCLLVAGGSKVYSLNKTIRPNCYNGYVHT